MLLHDYTEPYNLRCPYSCVWSHPPESMVNVREALKKSDSPSPELSTAISFISVSVRAGSSFPSHPIDILVKLITLVNSIPFVSVLHESLSTVLLS